MSNATIHQVYVDAFRDNVRHLAQQKGSKLRQYCDEFSPEAQTGNWDRLSKGEATAKTRKMATPETGRVWSRRIAIATPINDAEITEVEDPSLMLADPNSNIVQSLGYSMGRAMDDIIIAAATGTATNSVRANPGDGSNTPTQVALPTGQIAGTGAAGMTFDLVTEALEKFNAADIDMDEFKVAVIGPRQVRELMNLTEQTSADYVQARALQQNGIVPNWMGCTWVLSNRLGGAAGQRDCLLFTRKALGFHIPQDITVFVERDPSLSYAWRPYAQFTAGAVRVEDEQLVIMRVLDATNT